MDNTKCRFCGSDLKQTFVDLGLSPLANAYIEKKDLDKGQIFYPLIAKVCDRCFLVQVLSYEKPENIFSDYKYFSSVSKSWLKQCEEYVDYIVSALELNKKSKVLEIACNDGYLLQYFKKYNIYAYGVEPAANVAQEALNKGIDVVVDFFDDEVATRLLSTQGKADLIIGNNVLAHVPDIKSFVRGMKILLDDYGTITMEFPHLLNLIQGNQFDTIYHEHFSYFSLITVIKIFEAHNMKIYNVEKLPTHGGSIRIYATHLNNDRINQMNSMVSILNEEIDFGLNKIEVYSFFSERVQQIKRNSIRFLSDLKENGKTVVAFGAAAKGNTFLNYCGIGRDFIDYVVDSNTHKQGLYLPGTMIPIVNKDELQESKPDYVLLLPWNLKDEIIKEVAFTRSWDCKLITLIPQIDIC